MRRFAFVTFTSVLLSLALNAMADPRTMGTDYRTMLANFHMISEIAQRCPNLELPAMDPRPKVEKMLQDKLGMDLYVETMIKIQRSSLRNDALATIDKLWEQIDGCDDVRLAGSLRRIAGVQADSFARFEKEPTLVKPKPVPVPMRQR